METPTTSRSARWPWTLSRPAPPQPAQPQEPNDYVSIGGRKFAVEIVLERRRTAVAHFSSDRITIKLPHRLSRRERTSVIESLTRRSIKHLERLALTGFQALDNPRSLVAFRDGDQVTVMGRPMRISVSQPVNARRSRARFVDGSTVLVTLATTLDQSKREEKASELVRQVISAQMLPEVRAQLDALNARYYNFKVSSVRIRRQSRLWGSASHHNASINLNFRLLFAPYPIFEYVMAHELAHMECHNHGHAFWKIVERALPDYKERRKWLRENGDRLGISIR